MWFKRRERRPPTYPTPLVSGELRLDPSLQTVAEVLAERRWSEVAAAAPGPTDSLAT